jgi:transposase
MTQSRKPYPSDVSDEEWALVAPYLALLPEESGQRVHALREVFNGLRYMVKTGAPWRWMPNDLPPWEIVYQQSRRWLSAGCFEALAEDLRVILRLAAGRAAQPTVAIIDSRTLRSTPESGARAAYDGAKRKKGSKLHLAVDTLGHLLVLHVTPANADDRAEVGKIAKAIQARRERRDRLRRSGLYRREARSSGRRTWHRARGHQAARGQTRLRPPAPTMGRRAVLRMGHSLPTARERLRAMRTDPRRSPPRRLRMHHAQKRR